MPIPTCFEEVLVRARNLEKALFFGAAHSTLEATPQLIDGRDARGRFHREARFGSLSREGKTLRTVVVSANTGVLNAKRSAEDGVSRSEIRANE